MLYHLAVLLRSRESRSTVLGAMRAARLAQMSRRRLSAARRESTPVVERFIDDCETPVSAFLKLRAAFERPGVPARVGRAGAARPLLVPRLSPARDAALDLGDDGDPYGRGGRPRRAATTSPSSTSCRRSPGGAVGFFGYDLVRTVEPLGEPNPDPLGLPDMALMVCELMLVFDHQKHEVSRDRVPFATDGDVEARLTPAPRGDRRGPRALRRPVPRPGLDARREPGHSTRT